MSGDLPMRSEALCRAKRRSPIVMAILCLVVPSTFAGQLASAEHVMNVRLVLGQGVPVCEAYRREVSISGSRPTAAECPADITRHSTDISLVQLRPIFGSIAEMLAAHWEDSLGSQVIDYFWKRDANPAYYLGVGTFAQWRGTRTQVDESKRTFGAQLLRRYNFEQRLASVDVDNDGSLDPVLLLPVRACSTGLPMMPIVLTPDLAAIDEHKTALIAPHPSRASGLWREGEATAPHGQNQRSAYVDAFQAARYTFFVFQGKTYISLEWTEEVAPALRGAASRENSFWRNRVFIAEGRSTREICATQRTWP